MTVSFRHDRAKPRYDLDNAELERTGLVAVANVAYDLKATVIDEVGVMALAVKQVNLFAVFFCPEHSILGEVIGRPFPFKRLPNQAIRVLLSSGLFLLGHKENYLVVFSRGHNPASYSVETRITPELC